MAFRRIKTEKKTITPRIAQIYMEHNWGGQRNIRDYLVEAYGRAMARKEFLSQPLTLAIILDRNSIPEPYKQLNDFLMLDGQHRTDAARRYGLSFPADVQLYECDKWEDFIKLNELIDISNRSENDMNLYWLARMKKDWSLVMVKAIKAAIISRMGIAIATISKPERLIILEENFPIIKQVVGLLKQYTFEDIRFILRKPIMAALMDTITADFNKAEIFWNKIISMIRLSEDWELKLAKELRKPVGKGKGQHAKTEKKYRMVIKEWNRLYPESPIEGNYTRSGSGRKPNGEYRVLETPPEI